MAKWMWYPGDFELYHAMLVHNRRENKGLYYSPMWRVDAPHSNVRVYKIANLSEKEHFRAISNKALEIVINNKRFTPGEDIVLDEGRNFIKLSSYSDGGLPCIYCEGKTFASDESWTLASFSMGDYPVGTNDMYQSPDDNPEIFKFSYKRLYPVSSEKVTAGTLYDFGREIMGKLVVSGGKAGEKRLFVYGESREEALDSKEAIITENAVLTGETVSLRSRACRYIFVSDGESELDISYDYEYLPVERRGSFSCGDEFVNKIWDISAYTLELNTREGYFDGIKRDRWIWSGDAYQSYFVNYYLTADTDTVRRTTMMLRGSGIMPQHINTIVDYSLYWLIGIWEYYYHLGDLKFVQTVYPKCREIWDLINSRLDENGFIVGYAKKGDWTFIDWSEMEKEGAVCAEQMLLCRAYEAWSECEKLLGEDGSEHRKKADKLRENINKFYWDNEKNAYIDSYVTGNRNVTRHANIFALLFGIADASQREKIINCVIKNDAVPAITTPYFEFFELDAMCSIGEYSYMTDMLHSYWGGMVKLGATTFWEAYNPKAQGAEHYVMYGSPYGKSLCHAWSASPIYLLGKYALGVRPTLPAYASFDVIPNTLGLGKISGRVPVLDGFVDVEADDSAVTVYTDKSGGTLVLGEKRYDIPVCEKFTVKK